MYYLRHIVLMIAMLLLAANCGGDKKSSAEADQVRELAGDLLNRRLYKQAIEQYEIYLKEFNIDNRETANVHYIIANTYFDRLKDYENALANYLKIIHLYPEFPYMDKVNQRKVACLERLGRSEDAQQALDESVQLDSSQVKKKRPGAVLARIGDRDITQGDLDFELDQLPPSVREQFTTKDKKLQFLNEYVATELLYDTAKRAGLDKDPEVIEGAFQATKMIMVRKLLKERVADKVQIADSDVKLYYGANKENYAEKDEKGNIKRQKPFEEVQQQVAQDYYLKKYQEAYQDLVQKMILAEDVKFYEQNIQ
jgi:tetratricopeptide (TPR) repeat protein